jgi:hypothetical protein
MQNLNARRVVDRMERPRADLTWGARSRRILGGVLLAGVIAATLGGCVVAPGYAAPAPVYYAPAPVYYAPAPVFVYGGRWQGRRGW